MKGVILAGKNQTEEIVNIQGNIYSSLIYDKTLIQHAVSTLKNSGVREILIIIEKENWEETIKSIENNFDHNIEITYKIQHKKGGTAQALLLAENFSNGGSLAVMQGNVLFENTFEDPIMMFKSGAVTTIKTSDDSSHAIVELNTDGSIRSIEENPILAKSKHAEAGFYLFDNTLFETIKKLEPSKSGNLDITQINKAYLRKNNITIYKIPGTCIEINTSTDIVEANIIAHEANGANRTYSTARKQLNESENQAKISIGIALYNSSRYLIPCLQSLQKQTYKNYEIILLDNNSSDETRTILEKQFTDIKVISSTENLGFGKAHNQIINSATGEYYACLNVDMIFEPNFLSELIKELKNNTKLGSVGGKIKRWDFDGYTENSGTIREMGKTNFIDSVGIKILPSHRFEDIGQGEVDHGQYDKEANIFGVSGAAVLYRMAALQDISFTLDDKTEYFDESMFMYKEDVDLAYRLQWAGWESMYVPSSISYHDRTISFTEKTNKMWSWIRNRRKKPARINLLSYLNHKILLEKNFTKKYSSDIKRATFWYNAKIFLYILIFETETLWAWKKYWDIRKKVAQKKQNMPRRVEQSKIEGLISS